MGLPVWRVTANDRFLWRSWDGEQVVYHADSGDTHRLNALGAQALHLLIAGPRTTAELVEHLRADCPGEPDASIVAIVNELVSRFERLGLIEPDA